MNLLMLKGLPASGKSTYAKLLVDHGEYTRINKDDMRAMLHNGRWSKTNEKFVVKLRDHIVRTVLSQGKNVVVDDTNFAPIHEQALRQIAQDHNANFQVKFIDTPLKECIERDLKRQASVGQDVIIQMYDQYLKPERTQAPKFDPSLPTAVICDIDGTLAHMTNRGPYDTSKYLDDEKDDTVHHAFARIAGSDTRIICSGRSAEFREATDQWLANHGISYDLLLMRPAKDVRKDSIVKRELYEKHIQGKYNVRLVLDDRNQVVDMWRDELGLTCFQVAPGNF